MVVIQPGSKIAQTDLKFAEIAQGHIIGFPSDLYKTWYSKPDSPDKITMAIVT